MIGLMVVLAVVAGVLVALNESIVGGILLTVVAMGLVVPFIGLFLMMVAVFPLVTVMLICSLAFGWDAPPAVFASEMSVEETPPGESRVHHLSFSRSARRRQFDHTTTYDDPRTPIIIANWLMRETAAS